MPPDTRLPLSRQQMLITALFCLLLTAWSCPYAYQAPTRPGIDQSWMWALNDALHSGRTFGQDFVFTYGPLGFLSFRNAEYLPGYALFLGDLVVFAGIFRLLWLITLGNRRWYWWLLPLPAVIAFRDAGYSQQLFLLFAANVCMQIAAPRISWFQVIFTPLCGILLFFIKVNYGIFAIPLLVVANTYSINGNSTKGIVQLAFAILLFAILTAALPVSIPGYIRNSLPLISGYDEAMCLGIHEWALYDFAIVLLACTVIPIAAALRKDLIKQLGWLRVALLAAIYLLCCLLFFKNAFTRCDYPHYIVFFATLPLFFVLLAMGCGFRGWQAGALSVVVSTLSLYALVSTSDADKQVRLANLTYRVDISGYYTQLFAVLPRSYDPAFILPPGVCRRIGNNTVDLLPHELTWIWTNHLHYAPRPVPQSYSVYTRELDSLNAAFFATQKRPGFVLLNSIDFEQRYALWDESLTKAALHLNYRFDTTADTTKTDRASVVYSAIPGAYSRPMFAPLSHTTAHLGERIPVPVANKPVYMSLQLKYTPEGVIDKLIYQPAGCFITFITADGAWHTYRLIRHIADHPVLISSFVADNKDLCRFLDGNERNNMPITAFMVSTHGSGIEPRIDVQFSTFSNY